MAIREIPFVSGYAKHDSPDVSSAGMINMFVELLAPEGVKQQKIARAVSGSTRWADLSTANGVCRMMHTASNGVLYVVYGATLYKVNANKSYTALLNVGSGAQKIRVSSDAFVLMICDGQTMWSINLTDNEVIAVNTIGFSNPKQVVYFGNRFVAINNDKGYSENEADDPLDAVVLNSNKFYYSTLNKSSEWLALSNEVASTGADPITALAVTNNELWVFGSESYEPWRYTGNATAPFERASGAGGWVGCYSADSVVTIGDKVFWLGSGKDGYARIWTNGSTYEPVAVSNVQLNQKLSKTIESGITLTDAVAFSYSERGHTFYVISFINANFTFAYDLTTGEWHERSSRHPTLGTQQRWNYMFSASAYDKVFVADERNPYIMQLSMDTFDEYSNIPEKRLDIRRVITSPVFHNGGSPFILNMIQVDVETGVGTSTGQGINPMCAFRISRDGGHTFEPERTVPLGKIGEYKTTVELRRCGMAKNFVIEWVVSDPVKTVFISARMDAQPTSKR